MLMDNLFKKPMQTDDLFPKGLVQEFQGFMYTTSSKEIQKDDLVLTVVEVHQQDEFGEPAVDDLGFPIEPQLIYLVCLCLDVDGDVLTLRSNNTTITSGRTYCRKLTFTIPVNKTHFINN